MGGEYQSNHGALDTRSCQQASHPQVSDCSNKPCLGTKEQADLCPAHSTLVGAKTLSLIFIQ